MEPIDLIYMQETHSEEVLNLCSINERFDSEPVDVQVIRHQYAEIFGTLCTKRDEAGRSEAGRNYAIAITDLENSCIRAVKAMYSK